MRSNWKSKAVERVVYYDAGYKAIFVSNPESARDYFCKKGFRALTANELQTWMLDSINNDTAHRCIAVFIQSIVPETIFETLNSTCVLRRFLDKGGRVVWRGDVPLFYRGLHTGAMDDLGFQTPGIVLGVPYEPVRVKGNNAPNGQLFDFDTKFPVAITKAGKEIGIGQNKPPIRPVPRQMVDITYAEIAEQVDIEPMDYSGRPYLDGYFACCWKKNYNANYPHSGFMQYYLGQWDGTSDEECEAFLKFALSGWPLTYFSTPPLGM